MLVCGNTAAMLEESHFGRYITVSGDRSTHFGLFDCEPESAQTVGNGGCCSPTPRELL